MTNYTKIAGIWLAIILASLGSRYILMQGASYVTLEPAPDLSGAISQSLSSTTGKTLPQPGKDYAIKNIKYFENNSWALVTMDNSSGQNSNSVFAVMYNINGAYRIVLGPGTAFSKDETASLPADVTQALSDSGVLIYTPSGGS